MNWVRTLCRVLSLCGVSKLSDQQSRLSCTALLSDNMPQSKVDTEHHTEGNNQRLGKIVEKIFKRLTL
jgi:hypothetical protein